MAQSLRAFPFPDRPHGVADTLPELRDIDYQNEVLQLPTQLPTDDHDAYLERLITRAASLGISFSRPPSAASTPDNHDSSGAESNATLDTTHVRTISTGSGASASTTRTSHSSNNGHSHTGNILTRRRSRGLTFAQYETYISHIKPTLGQSKFSTSPQVEPTPGLFSVGRRKSYTVIQHSISKLRGKRKPAAPSESSIMCRAQFCYICGAVWDPTVGCPNFCNGDEEMERRRQEEEARIAALEAEEAIKREAAAKEAAEELEIEVRTQNSDEFKSLRAEQVKEMERFGAFVQKSRWLLWTRHAQQKVALVEKHSAAIEKMLERHAKTSANLEDRQVAAEMELRCTLEQSERHVRVRLKHMEAYCDGLGLDPASETPSRVVSERDLRELRQQYNLERNMKQLHQAKINVMRDRQAKALEQLLERQECEVERLMEKNAKEIEHLESDFADEEDTFATTFSARQSTLEARWKLEMEIIRKELENERGVRYNLLPPLEWPQEKGGFEDGLVAMDE
ncbi:hypothetical protein EKO27_g10019 [Xylaria grammica]|uniref:IBR domain-containing protein n=1 Tax=Xylaria grammica TaxID=363999 RepID=A0A439CSE1_9PEZI|nr:hypothetical protein EKO27_g10019 [Xylaria grammica]